MDKTRLDSEDEQRGREEGQPLIKTARARVDTFYTLSDIARAYGITRQRAGQLYQEQGWKSDDTRSGFPLFRKIPRRPEKIKSGRPRISETARMRNDKQPKKRGVEKMTTINRSETKGFVLYLPKDLHRTIKMEAVRQDRTINEILVEIITAGLGKTDKA